MLAVNVPFCLSRIKPPSSSAKPIGVKARKQAKLGKILDKVYNDLQTKKLQSKRDN